MSRFSNRRWLVVLGAAALAAGLASAALAGDDLTTGASPPGGARDSLLDFVLAGGPVGYVILALSVAAMALVIDAAVHVRIQLLVPASLTRQAEKLARAGRFSELLALSQASDSLAGRVMGEALAQGHLGVEAVRDALQQAGTREITRLRQRVGTLGLLAAAAPMLGLLGTVVGMIGSFDVLGTSKGAARPDELAVGVSQALVTTCMGLIVALPLMFFHNCFRDRVTRVSQELEALCERLLRTITAVVDARAGAAAPRRGPGGVDLTDREIEDALGDLNG